MDLDQIEQRDPEALFAGPEEKAVACAITITSQVGSNRSIVMQTYLARDIGIVTYHETLDKLSKAVDRQEAKVQLEAMQQHLVRLETDRDNFARDYIEIETRAQTAWENRGKKGAFKLSDNENVQRKQAQANFAKTKENIERLKEDIEKTRGVINDVN